jgi:hypothetical protein
VIDAQEPESEFEPAVPSRQIIEAASWELAAGVVRRYPFRFRVIETHPGGGQYDCLTLIDKSRQSQLDHIDLNRAGSIFVWAKQGGWAWVWRGAWSELVAKEDTESLVDRLCRRSMLPMPSASPRTSPTSNGVRFVAAFLKQAMFGPTHWDCRNATEDTSGGSGGTRTSLFDRFPRARQRLEVGERGDLFGVPGYRFWFLQQEREPRLALELSRGTAWLQDGREIDLVALYRKEGRRIAPLVWAAAGHLLP